MAKKPRNFSFIFQQKNCLYIFVISLFLANQNFKIYDYFKNSFANDDGYFADNFIDPSQVKIKRDLSKKQKSLVLIYLESVEKNYENGELFKSEPLKNLNRHKKLSFEKYSQIFPDGAGSTIAGIISSQCAIPFKSSLVFAKIDFSKVKLNSFLPNSICLGDNLKKLGYKNVFLGGANLRFANKGVFLKTHGYDELYGKNKWVESGDYVDANMSGWGLYDRDLFVEARKKIDCEI